jgi:nucleotide-binding universal stress UspA family protein
MNAYPILVGYDGSANATAALTWAQQEAARRSAPVELVYVYEWATAVAPVPVGAIWPDRAVRREAVAMVEEAVTRAVAAHPEVPLTGTVVDGSAVPTLRSRSERAQLLVLGNRGLGGFTGLLAGSVATGVATHARCPVVVVRGCAPPHQPVVVGVDESPDADRAIGFAFDQAAGCGVPLVAVRAWQPPPVPWRTDVRPLVYDADELAGAERQLAGQALAGWQEKHPDVPVTIRLMPSTPAHALITASAEAQLVVVGSRGRGGFRGLLLGSVARQLIHHARSPVAVVRDVTEPGPIRSGGPEEVLR